MDSIKRLVLALWHVVVPPRFDADLYVYPVQAGQNLGWCWELHKNGALLTEGIRYSLAECEWDAVCEASRRGLLAEMHWGAPEDLG